MGINKRGAIHYEYNNVGEKEMNYPPINGFRKLNPDEIIQDGDVFVIQSSTQRYSVTYTYSSLGRTVASKELDTRLYYRPNKWTKITDWSGKLLKGDVVCYNSDHSPERVIKSKNDQFGFIAPINYDQSIKYHLRDYDKPSLWRKSEGQNSRKLTGNAIYSKPLPLP